MSGRPGLCPGVVGGLDEAATGTTGPGLHPPGCQRDANPRGLGEATYNSSPPR